jgi:hypothetical protein
MLTTFRINFTDKLSTRAANNAPVSVLAQGVLLLLIISSHLPEVCQKFNQNTVSIVCRGSDGMLPSSFRAIGWSDRADRLPVYFTASCLTAPDSASR